MYAWISLVFSCTMMVVAAAGKSGYQLLPTNIAATPAMEFMFLIGCAGFGAALAMLAPSHSSARLASIWSSAALGIVVIVLNLDHLNLRENKQVETGPENVIVVPEATDKEQPPIDFVLKRTIDENKWQPFQDFEYRIKTIERAQPQPSQDSEINHAPPPENAG